MRPPALRLARPLDSPAHRQSVGRLRRMKTTATVLLGVAAAVYIATLVIPGWPHGARGWVQAGAEAAMVGGLADWFAVTALFRRPLGLPIPHTALIPRKKDDLAVKLGEFVTGHFLTPETLQAQVAEAQVVARVGRWLADREHAELLAREAAAGAGRALEGMDAGVIVDALIDLLRRDDARRSYAPLLGRLLARAVDGGAQRPLVDVLAERARIYLAANAEALQPTVKRFIEERHWVAWLVTTDRVVARLLRDVGRELDAIEHQRAHPVRIALDDLLRSVAQDLQTNPKTVLAVDRLAAQLLDDPRTRAVVADAVEHALGTLRHALGDGEGDTVARLAGVVQSLGRRLVDDDPFRGQVERTLQRIIGHAVSRYGQALTQLIRQQVGGWPAADASRRIELAVGRDLQYIRVNGTAVGAIAGLAIHAVGLLL
ncbi:MAG TPA: DUF445 domain-containing protein [Acidimicrobiales bacterium]|nr:DUF445 domain-containing protein [Acidimicrobiales bacterium]